jgi:hypothetical protein
MISQIGTGVIRNFSARVEGRGSWCVIFLKMHTEVFKQATVDDFTIERSQVSHLGRS